MFEFFTKPIYNLFDSSKKLSNRITSFLLVILTLFIVNDITHFTKDYRINNRLQQIKLLKEIEGSSERFESEIVEIKFEMSNQKNVFQQIGELYYSASNSDLTTDNSPIEFSFINWYNFSASFTFVLLMLLLPFGFFTANGSNRRSLILGVVFGELIFGTCAWLAVKVFAIIPLFENIHWNYALNIILNIVFILVVAFLSKKSKD